MKICLDCWHLFEDGEVATWREYVGECWGRPAYKTMSGCPDCRGNYEEAYQCNECGRYLPLGELDENHLCEYCHEEERAWEVRLSNDELYWLDDKCVVETICDAEDADWKTSMVHKIPKIPKGTQLEVNSVWRNLCGVWVEVNYGGRRYDISPRQLKYVKRNE